MELISEAEMPSRTTVDGRRSVQLGFAQTGTGLSNFIKNRHLLLAHVLIGGCP